MRDKSYIVFVGVFIWDILESFVRDDVFWHIMIASALFKFSEDGTPLSKKLGSPPCISAMSRSAIWKKGHNPDP